MARPLLKTITGPRVKEKLFQYRYRAIWIKTVLLATFIALSATACRLGKPVIDTTPGPAQADGTISGTVRGPDGTSPVSGRMVEVVNVDTGERQRVATNRAGGFTFKVKPGKYQVQLTLREGEILVKKPSVIDVNRSDVDAHADFVLGVARVVRPRLPQIRSDHGLGSPSA